MNSTMVCFCFIPTTYSHKLELENAIMSEQSCGEPTTTIDRPRASVVKQHRNRLFLLAGHVILGFLCLAFIHRFIAERVIPIPHEDLIQLNETLQNVSDHYTENIAREGSIIREQILQSHQEELDRVSVILEANQNDIIEEQWTREGSIQEMHDTFYFYLQSWSHVGNEIPFRDDITDGQKLMLEQTYGFDSEQTTKDLSEGVTRLDQQLLAVAKYNRDYIRNKTGLASMHLDLINDVPELSPIDTMFISDMRDSILNYIAETREDIESFFAMVLEQLQKTKMSFEAIAIKFDGLRQLYLDVYDIVQLFDVPGVELSKIPLLDIDYGFPSNFYKIDGMDFPDISVFLEPIDDLEIFITNVFRELEFTYVTNFNTTLNMQLNTNFEPLRLALKSWKPEDYNPPPIRNPFNSQKVTLEVAESLKAEILSNITDMSNAIVRPQLETDDLIQIPTIDGFAHTTLHLGNPELAMSSLFRNLWNLGLWLYEYLQIFISWGWIVLNVWNFYYTILMKSREKYNETRTTKPTIDLRTEEEKEVETGKNRKNSNNEKKSNMFFAAIKASYFLASHPMVLKIFYALLAVASFLFGYWCKIHYTSDFYTHCVESNAYETRMGVQFMHESAFYAGSNKMLQVVKENQFEIQLQCGDGERFVYTQLQKQVRDFERSKQKSEFLLQEVQQAESIVDLELLCLRHREACNEDSPSLRVCPTFEDGSILDDPCEMLFDIPAQNQVLVEADYNCGVLGTATMNTTQMQEDALQNLDLRSEACAIQLVFYGKLLQFAYVALFVLLLHFAREIIYNGVRKCAWHHLREPKFDIIATVNMDGTFTDPESSDVEARKEAIQRKRVFDWRRGVLSIAFGILILTFWTFVTFWLWNTKAIPDQYLQTKTAFAIKEHLGNRMLRGST